MEKATLGGGCFWCTEAVFSKVKGVIDVRPGYAGGTFPNPTYEDVCSDTTGHAEVVQITFNPSVISFRDLLEIFFEIHDPTTPNRQGNDVGSQYRSIILYHSEEQRKIAQEVIEEVQKRLGKKVVTELKPFDVFYEAEDYHHRYFERHPNQPYCRIVMSPKVKKFMYHFPDRVRMEEAK
ncbi:Peptide methionine sulfoxide reductase MsrA [Sulfuracidifex tepidarius]|uniref:Peptide methionine sulfoxide reductase MsrA n=1 Tax=Sulfuracidifex tepidarius TaxID=1294262 RepID=A0A510DU83_9CREN|nr:peptide-methionine (S)-S-oxide reductase MsrA [Sulfuracidifex tepidarius]BBG23761.1 Peptide methionine sulfoxide reductase MsrA [Sulfuracidifex tepidarius]